MDYALLERLCNVSGTSGYEEQAQEVVREYLEPYCDTIHQDRLVEYDGTYGSWFLPCVISL